VALNWRSVRAEHVARACDLLLTGQHRPKAQAKGLLVTYQGQQLPAKHVLRLAYCLANGLPLESKLKFSSREGTLARLKALGFPEERKGAEAVAPVEREGVAGFVTRLGYQPADYIEVRARRTDVSRYRTVCAKVPDDPLQPGDEVDPPGGPSRGPWPAALK
jgi:hypothetical protein